MRMETTTHMTSKYDCLKDQPSITYTGSKFVDNYFTTIHIDGRVVAIAGFPACPDCEVTLDRDFASDLWKCFKCSHAWDTESLVRRLEEKREEYDDSMETEGLP